MGDIETIKEAEKEADSLINQAKIDSEKRIAGVKKACNEKLANVESSLEKDIALVLKNAKNEAIKIKEQKELEREELLRELERSINEKTNGTVEIVLNKIFHRNGSQ
ncbi:MAG: hypothetical protein ABIB55_01455 [Candidatus Nealsonbacteria bacterium]